MLCHCWLGGKKSRVLVYKINLTSAMSNDFSLGSLWRPGLTWIDWQNRLVKLSSLCVGSSGTATQNQTYSQKLLYPCQSRAMFTGLSLSLSLSISLSLSLSLSLCVCALTAIFRCGPRLASTRMSPFWILLELRMMEVVSGDNWSYKTCKAAAKLSPPTNQHPV